MSSQSLRITLTKELERIAKIEQPVRRAREYRQVQRVFGDFQPELAEGLRVAVREMREVYGYSWTDVAQEFKVSRARAQQIGTA